MGPAFAGTTPDVQQAPGALLRRLSSRRGADIARDITVTLHHHVGQVLRLVRDVAAGAHGVAVLVRDMRRLDALLQGARGVEHQLAEMHDAEIGRAEVLPGAILNRTLAVLHGGVLLGDALSLRSIR